MLNKIYFSVIRDVSQPARPFFRSDLFGIGTAISGLFGAGASIANNERQMAEQRKSQERQNDWQSSENEKDRLWQEQQWLEQFNKTNEENDRRFGQENQEWERRFNLENEYNDPSAVMARLKAAGVNPSAALGQLSGSGGLAAAGGSSSPGMPTTPSPALAGPHAVTPMGLSNPNSILNIGGLVSGFADMLNAKSNAKKVGLEETYQNATLDAVVEKLKKDADYQDKAAALADFDLQLKQLVGDAEIRSRITKNLADAALADQKGETEKTQQALNRALEILTDTKNDSIIKALPLLLTNLGRIGEVYKSEAYRNYAAGSRDNAETQTINETRQYDVAFAKFSSELEQYRRDIASADNYVAQNTKHDRVESMTQSLEQSGILTKTMAVQLQQAIFRKDWQAVDKFVEYMKAGADIYSDIKGVSIKQQDADSRSKSSQAFENDVEYREHDREVKRRQAYNKSKKK